MDKYEQLLELVKSAEEDFVKFYGKGNKTAGIRLRKKMQEIRSLAKSIRIEVQAINENKPGADTNP